MLCRYCSVPFSPVLCSATPTPDVPCASSCSSSRDAPNRRPARSNWGAAEPGLGEGDDTEQDSPSEVVAGWAGIRAVVAARPTRATGTPFARRRHSRARSRGEDGGDTGEVPLASFGVFAQGDLLTRTVVERMLAGVATRSFERVADPIGERHRKAASSTSKSAVSRRLVTGTKKALDELLVRDLASLEAAVLMIDGVHFAGQACVVALVVTADGTKVPVGLRLGDTENKTVVTALLADLAARGLDPSGGLLVVTDGAKALATGARAVFGDLALIQRCQLHKRRIDRPSGAGQGPWPEGWLRSRCRRWRSRASTTRSWRAASSVQPRWSASSRSARMSSRWCSRTSARSGSGTKLSHCSQMLA